MMVKEFFRKNYAGNLLLGLVNLGLVLLIVLVLVKPAFDDSAVLFGLGKDFFSLEQKRTNFDQLKRDYQKYQAEIGKVGDLFVAREAPVEFIGFLEESSWNTGFAVKISSASFSVSKSDIWPSTVFRLSGKGTSSSFQRFLEKIENSPYLMEVSGLSLGKVKAALAGEGKSAGEIEMAADLKIFTK